MSANDITRLTELGRAFAAVTPCTCSAQRERAERAEATIARVRELADQWDSSEALARALRAALDGEGDQ